MEFKNGTNVFTVEGKEAGHLNRVVINPDSREITHLIVQKGLISAEVRVVPFEKVASATNDGVALTCTSDEFKEMSPLEINQYSSGGEEQNFDRMGGGPYVAPPVGHNPLKETVRTIPDEMIALKDGAPVISEDNKHVGDIEKVFADSGKITHFIASHGIILKTRKAIPIEWVQTLSDDEVKLTVGASQVDDMPVDQS